MTIPVRLLLCAFCVLLSAFPLLAQTTQPQSDEPLITQLTALSKKLEGVQDLSARFRQEKFTPLLRKPLVSTGTVRTAGATMRWDTLKPAESVMLITDEDVRLYYPKQALVEVYRFDQQMVKMASSPIPRIDLLKEQFAVQPDALPQAKDAAGKRLLPVKLLPLKKEVQEHLDHVSLLIDEDSGYLWQMEMVDGDGERTVIRFEELKLNSGIQEADLKLVTPPGTKVSYPLGEGGGK